MLNRTRHAHGAYKQPKLSSLDERLDNVDATRCLGCGANLTTSSPVAARAIGRSVAMATGPRPGCETIAPHLRYRLLLQMSQQLDRGVRDPELLYLGGRYAASLGMEQQACKFLDPLVATLCEGDRVWPAYFPIGLLY